MVVAGDSAVGLAMGMDLGDCLWFGVWKFC